MGGQQRQRRCSSQKQRETQLLVAAGSQGPSVTQQEWAVSPVHEVPLYHVRTLELAGMAFWVLPAEELWLEKRRHRLIITLPSISAAPPRMGSSSPAPFPSSRTVRTKRDYQIPSVENQEAIAQTLSK